jgi:HD-GYP domain-containing protein (c-di-GMP phosphodiesterase class II)
VASAADVSEELVREARSRARAPHLDRRAVTPFLMSGGAVIVGAVACALVLPTGGWWRAAVFVALYAVASRVEFEIGSGAAVASEVILVPLLFAVPLGLVPGVVAAGLVVGMFARRPRELLDPMRALPSIGSAAHAFGPVIVLAAANGMPLRWSAAPIYAGALGAQFAFDAGAAAIGNSRRGVDMRSVARFLTFAWMVDAALAPVGLALAFADRGRAYVVVVALPLLFLLRAFSRERQLRIDNALELGDAYRGTALLLGDVIEAEDAYTGSHSRHVVSLVSGVSGRLALSNEERRDAEFAALLHDVGKIRIPDEILNKPGPLTADERAVMQSHAVEGERMLNRVGGLLGQVGRVVRSCHERWDGAGYPDGLAGEQIPLVSRIVSACDAYSAMTTDRPYRAALPESHARAELDRCAGTQFDPRVVEAVLGVVSVGG